MIGIKSNVRVRMTVTALSIACGAGALQGAALGQANQDGVVAVGGVSILTIRRAAAGMSVKQRADAVTDRLRFILADPNLKASDIVAVSIDNSNAKIMVKDRILVTIDMDTAKLDSTTPIKLARSWAEHLRKVLPQVNVQPNPNDKK